MRVSQEWIGMVGSKGPDCFAPALSEAEMNSPRFQSDANR